MGICKSPQDLRFGPMAAAWDGIHELQSDHAAFMGVPNSVDLSLSATT